MSAGAAKQDGGCERGAWLGAEYSRDWEGGWYWV